jgi:hypothetical protein
VVLVENRAAFEARYGTGRPVIGVYDGDLDNSGERLRLEDGSGATILDFFYGDSAWLPLADGAGYSMVVVNPQAAAGTWGAQQSWRAANSLHGTPGLPDGAAAAAVLARQVFYNRSTFDGNNPAANASDDNAIATDKRALLPGGAATFANVTSYSRGLNGVFIDVRNFTAAPTAADFVFRTGAAGNPATWPLAAAPTITLRRGAGIGGSDRLTLTWPDNAINNAWLQVTINPGGNTGLAAADVFYFGNLVGETGDGAAATARVNAVDLAQVRRHFSPRNVAVDSTYDLNRDGQVNSLDVLIAKSNQGLHTLRMFTAPGTTPAAAAAAPPVVVVVASPFGEKRIAARGRGVTALL